MATERQLHSKSFENLRQPILIGGISLNSGCSDQGLCLAKIAICCRIRQISGMPTSVSLRVKIASCCAWLRLLLVLLAGSARSRHDLPLEILALRRQLGVLKQRHPIPRFIVSDKLFWQMLRRLRPGWKRALILVQTETVVRWRRAEFKCYWKWLSRHRRNRAGRKCVRQRLRELIFRMVAENPISGAPRIHGECSASIFRSDPC